MKPPNALPHKTDNGNVVVTTHLYDGKKSLPLDIELYQHGDSLAEGKKDPEFKKKPTLALELIDKSLNREYRPGIVLIDSSYGNNASFLKDLEEHDPYQWINEFDNEDREEMVAEILQTLRYAEETNDWDELKSVIFEWRESAIANQGNELDEFKEALKENPVS